MIETPNNHFIFNFTLWCNFAGEWKTKVVPSCLSFPLRWMNNLFLISFSNSLSLSLSPSQLKWLFMLFYFSPPNLPFQWANFFFKSFPSPTSFFFECGEIIVSCNQWEGSVCTPEGSSFFLCGVGRVMEQFFAFFVPCSQCVFIMFIWRSPSCSQ